MMDVHEDHAQGVNNIWEVGCVGRLEHRALYILQGLASSV